MSEAKSFKIMLTTGDSIFHVLKHSQRSQRPHRGIFNCNYVSSANNDTLRMAAIFDFCNMLSQG